MLRKNEPNGKDSFDRHDHAERKRNIFRISLLLRKGADEKWVLGHYELKNYKLFLHFC